VSAGPAEPAGRRGPRPSRLERGALRDLTGSVERLGFKLELVPLVSGDLEQHPRGKDYTR